MPIMFFLREPIGKSSSNLDLENGRQGETKGKVERQDQNIYTDYLRIWTNT
jgi:hypothetical protein